jgi:hypothetical protein
MGLSDFLQQEGGRHHRIGSFTEARDMIDMDDSRLKTEIDDIVAKINKTIKNIESVVPLNAPKADTSDDKKDDPSPAVDEALQEGSQSP